MAVNAPLGPPALVCPGELSIDDYCTCMLNMYIKTGSALGNNRRTDGLRQISTYFWVRRGIPKLIMGRVKLPV